MHTLFSQSNPIPRNIKTTAREGFEKAANIDNRELESGVFAQKNDLNDYLFIKTVDKLLFSFIRHWLFNLI